jgi:hypothetical protein
MIFTRWLQEKFGVNVYIEITDDEKFVYKRESEWKDILKEMASTDMGLDDIHYSRAFGGNAKTIDLCKINEHIRTTEDNFDCANQAMLFERKIQPFDFTERLKVIAELIESREQAAVSFYIGFNVHPSTITILGN